MVLPLFAKNYRVPKMRIYSLFGRLKTHKILSVIYTQYTHQIVILLISFTSSPGATCV